MCLFPEKRRRELRWQGRDTGGQFSETGVECDRIDHGFDHPVTYQPIHFSIKAIFSETSTDLQNCSASSPHLQQQQSSPVQLLHPQGDT